MNTTVAATGNATETRSVVIERELPHPPEKVWRALTQPALLAEWMMANDFQPVVGHRFKFTAEPVANWDGVVRCEVLEVQPHSKLSYRWGVGGADAASGLSTVVTLTLTPTGKGTLLRMEQSGFGPGREQNIQGAKYGWQRFLGGLEKVLAQI